MPFGSVVRLWLQVVISLHDYLRADTCHSASVREALIKKHMNKDFDLTELIKAKGKPYPRKLGRYNASEVYAIFAGWKSPEDWVFPQDIDVKSLMRMNMGTIIHSHIQSYLEPQRCEVKRTYTTPDGEITIVGKADYLLDDDVWDIKTSESELAKSKPWQEHQVKMYCTMFERPHGKIMQPVRTEESLYLRCVGEVTRDDAWFLGEVEKLRAFHEKVKALWPLYEATRI